MKESKASEAARKILEHVGDLKLPPICAAALRGESCTAIAVETARRLNKELEESGKDSFTLGDLRRIQNEMFNIKT